MGHLLPGPGLWTMKFRDLPWYLLHGSVRYILARVRYVPYILARRVGDGCRFHRIESILARKLSCQFLNSVVSKAVGIV